MGFGRIFIALLLSVWTTSGTAAEIADARMVDTDFGFVLVNDLDVPAAIAEGSAAKEGAERFFLIPDVTFAIVEEGVSERGRSPLADGYVVHMWPFPNGPLRHAPRPATHVLRHEIGHDLFVRHLVPRTTQDQYGSDAPDWLDEMAAIAFEGTEQELERRLMARMDADQVSLLPLPRLFSMAHPEFGRKIAISSGKTFAFGTPQSADTSRFYSTIRVLLDFLVDRTGTEAIVAELAAAFVRGESLGAWTAERVGYGKGAKSIEKMDADFLRWFAHDPRYRLHQSTE